MEQQPQSVVAVLIERLRHPTVFNLTSISGKLQMPLTSNKSIDGCTMLFSLKYEGRRSKSQGVSTSPDLWHIGDLAMQ